MKLHEGVLVAASRKDIKLWNVKKAFADQTISLESDPDINHVWIQIETFQAYTGSSQNVTIWDLSVVAFH